MPRQRVIKDVAKEIADEFDMYEYVIEEIINSQFRYVINYMEEGYTYPIRLTKLGAIMPLKRFRKYSRIKDYFKEHGNTKKVTY